MEKKSVKMIVLTNQLILLTQIEEASSELGEPDCKLIEPFVVNKENTLTPWLVDFTVQNTFMIHSDKILTISDPKPTLLEKYLDLIK